MGSPLRNKFGEALYKDRMSYERDLAKRLNRIDVDKNRSSLMFDSASQVFLNNAKGRREKWTDRDHKYRTYFKTICRSTQASKLENLNRVLDTGKLSVMNDNLQYKYLLLHRELELLEIEKLTGGKAQVLKIENSDSNRLILPYIKQVHAHVYDNPNGEAIEDEFYSLYNRYSESDLTFLHTCKLIIFIVLSCKVE